MVVFMFFNHCGGRMLFLIFRTIARRVMSLVNGRDSRYNKKAL
jgi:hypothetical protein